MNNWVHLPHTSVEYQYYKFVCGHYEAFGYKSLGTNQVDTIMSLDNRAEEAVLVATKHYKKARAIYNLLDMKDAAMIVEVLISGINAWVLDDATLSATLSSVTRPMLQTLGNAYELNHNDEGSDSELNIKMGLNYAGALWTMVDRCIEAERIASKLAAVSRRVHGSEHIVTIEANAMLKNAWGAMFMSCLRTNISKLCDTKMMDKFVSSWAPLQIQGKKRRRVFSTLQVISYYLVMGVQLSVMDW